MCSVPVQLSSERDRAVEAAQLARGEVEEELQQTQKRLRAVQVERNVLLVSKHVTRPVYFEVWVGIQIKGVHL